MQQKEMCVALRADVERGLGRLKRGWRAFCIGVLLLGTGLSARTAVAGSEYTISIGAAGGSGTVSISYSRYQDSYNYSSTGVYSENWISNVEVYDSVENRWRSLILLDNGQRYAGIQCVPYNVSKVRATCTANTGAARSFRGKLNGYGDYLTITQAKGTGTSSLTAPTVSIKTFGTNANASSITVTWSGGSGATSYNLYRSTSNSRPSSAYKTGVTSPYTDSDSSLQPGVKYYYWVEAKNSSGSAFSSSDWGNRAVSLSLGSAGTVTASGGNKSFSVTANTSWSATTSASWITLTGASGSGSGTCSFTASANSSTSSRTGTIVVTAGSGTAYPKSVTNTVTQSGNTVTAPTAPTVSIATYGTNANASSITVKWSGGSGATSYNLYRSTTSTRPSSAYKTGVTSPYTDTDSNLKPGVKYYYWVEAKNSAGSAFSNSDWGNRAVSLSLGSVGTVATSGGTKSFSVTANTSWSATTSASWITLTGASGSGSGTCSFTVAANSSTSSRTGTIVVTAGSGTSYPKSVTNTVTQSTAPVGTGTNKYAVCVGINEYEDISSLHGCVNDSKYMESNLVGAGWPSANVTRLNDSQATKKAIRKAITNVAAKAVAGDTFVFMQSSHGGQFNADPYNPDEPALTGENGKAVYLCVYDEDYYDNTTAYNDYELAADLAKFRTGVKVVVIVDACHSGGLFKSASKAKAAAASFNLAERVSEIMDANRAARKARGENVSKGLSSSEIGWATAAEYYEYSQDIGFYHTDAWLTDPVYGDEYLSTGYPSSYKVGGSFLASCTWGWWNGTADNASYGDRDGKCDAYEFWHYGYDFVSQLDSFWGAGFSFHPQCLNTDVLRSVELGPNGNGSGGSGGGTAPTAPTLSIATYGDNASASSITVRWSGGSGATSYNLYRSTSNSRPGSAYKTGVTSPYTDTDSNLQPGLKYYYWVEAKNSAGSAFSNSDWGNRAVSLSLGSVGTVAASGGNKSFSVTANTSWSAKSSVSWITLNSATSSGSGTCSFTVSANGSTSSRTGKIVVTAGSGTAYPKSVTNTVTQSGTPAPTPILTLGSASRSFAAAAANSKELSVTANVSWKASSNVSWLEVKTTSGSGNGKIVYNVKANTGSGSRAGTISVTGGGVTRTFIVTQEGSPVLALGAESRSFTSAAASGKELSVTARASWTAKSSASWLKLTTAKGSGNGKIVYNVAKNTGGTRTGKITVTGGGNTATFTVTQSGSGPILTLSAEGRTFTDAAANSKELSVTASVSWTAKSSVSWLKVTKGSGSGNGKIVYNVAANTGSSAREGTITVSGGGETKKFHVFQYGRNVDPVLTLGSGSRSFTADAANSKELSVTANVSWTAKSSATSWLTVKTASGSGNGKVVYNVAQNTGGTRTGTITVTGGGITRTFTVTQDGKGDTGGGSSANLSFTAAGGTKTATFTGVPMGYSSLSYSASWLSANYQLSSGNMTSGGTFTATVNVTVTANTTGGSRSGKVTLTAGGNTYTVNVTQAATKAKSASKGTGQVWVTTSDGSNGDAVADGDAETGWSPSGTGGAWVALTFEEPRDIGTVAVKGYSLPEGLRVLASEDGDDWSEEGCDEASYLWVVLPDEGAVPTVTEIECGP